MRGKEKLERTRNSIQQREKLSKEEKNLLCNDYVHELRSAESITSPYTFAKQINKLADITEYNEDLRLDKVDVSKKLNKTIRNQIQRSKYKKKNGEYAARTKKDYWTAWKYLLKHFHNIDVENSSEMPSVNFSSDTDNVDKQADTRPEDLPTPDQMRKLLKTIQLVSRGPVADRNAAYYLLMWDLGTRKGETLPIKFKDIDVQDDKVRFYIHGNKTSDSRWVRLFQGEEFIRNFIKNHPKRGDDDAYLFSKKDGGQVSGNQLKSKMIQAKQQADLSFKTYGEPNHIFRKGMNTYYIVNNILSWEEVCKRLGKSPDSTKPDYLLMAIEDVELSAAQGFGLETSEIQRDGRMMQPPLLPQKCREGHKNHCLRENCSQCGAELETNQMPQNMNATTEEIKEAKREELLDQIKNTIELAEENGVDTKELFNDE